MLHLFSAPSHNLNGLKARVLHVFNVLSGNFKMSRKGCLHDNCNHLVSLFERRCSVPSLLVFYAYQSPIMLIKPLEGKSSRVARDIAARGRT